MAATNFAEMLDQVRERLGLHSKTTVKLGKAVGGLELSEAEAERVQDAINIELSRIYAERHLADSMHRVKHDEIETAEVNEHWEVGELKKGEVFSEDEHGQKWVNRPIHEVRRTNARNDCPDCHRELIGAGDAALPFLICSRLAGLKIALPGLTPHDIVACGIQAEAA